MAAGGRVQRCYEMLPDGELLDSGHWTHPLLGWMAVLAEVSEARGRTVPVAAPSPQRRYFPDF